MTHMGLMTAHQGPAHSFRALFCPQTKEDIANIVQQAQHPPTGPAEWEEDVYIDEAMDDVDQW